jgi:hypothetical protein
MRQLIFVLIVTAVSVPVAVGAEKPEEKQPTIRPRLSESVLTLGDKILRANDLKLAAEGPGKDGFADPEYLKKLRKEVNTAKASVAKDECALLAGPQVVPAGKGWNGDLQHSIFVAVARSEKSPWAGYLADCTVYELNESGEPIGMVNLPRMVNGWQGMVDEQGLVWACPRDAMVKLTPSSNRQSMGGMLGGHDMLCRVAWYCQPESLPVPKAWLTAGPAGDPVTYTPTHAFRPAGGGYILKRGEQVYRFPFRMIDLKSTQSQTLTLSVPFDGEVPKPESNYSESDGQIRTFGPYLLGVTWLEVRGGILQIVLGTESGAAAVDFEITQDGSEKTGSAGLPRVLVAYYSLTGNTEKMARGVAAGIGRVLGVTAVAKKVDEVSKQDLEAADGIILGSPTYYANIPGKMKVVIDKYPTMPVAISPGMPRLSHPPWPKCWAAATPGSATRPASR